LPNTKQAVVLGAGLVGMHAAENLAKAGAQVTVVEMQPRVLAGYFDAEASAIIEAAFAAKGVKLMLGAKVSRCETAGHGARVATDNGMSLDADLLLVAAGVAPVTDFLAGSGVDGRPRRPRRRQHAHQRGWHLGRRRRRPGERLLR
jgi:phenylglyoxylate dehydrogenase epsilon subunit